MQVTLQTTQPSATAPSSTLQTLTPQMTSTALPETLSSPILKTQVAQPQFLAQVLKILANNTAADVKILNTRQIIQLQPSVPLAKGQLVLLQQTTTGIKLQADAKATATQLMRLLIPKQGTVKNALSSIVRTLPPMGAESNKNTAQDREINKGTEDIARLIKSVISKLPSRQQVANPEQLKAFINASGLSPLAGRPTSVAASSATVDVEKTAAPNLPQTPLGQLLIPLLKALLQMSPKQNTRVHKEQTAALTEALSRILLNQIRIPGLADGDELNSRRMEIVARHENQLDGFQLQFLAPRVNPDREYSEQTSGKQGADAAEKKWIVNLHFEFPELGKITALIALTAEKHLEMSFWSDRPHTFTLINSQRKKFQKKLQKRLKTLGIESLKIEVFAGEAPLRQPLVASHLVNEIV